MRGVTGGSPPGGKQGTGRVLRAAAGRAGLGVRGQREAVGEGYWRRGGRRAPGAVGGAGAGTDVSRGHHFTDGGHPAGQADLVERRDVPALGRVHRDGHRARARPADPAADEQQPGAEQPGRAPVLHRLEERQVHQAGHVVERREDDPLPGPHGRGLRRHLHPADEDHLPAPAAVQAVGADHAELVEELGVEVEHVPAEVEAEDLELGGDAFGLVEVAKLPAGTRSAMPSAASAPPKSSSAAAAPRAPARSSTPTRASRSRRVGRSPRAKGPRAVWTEERGAQRRATREDGV